MSDNTPSYPIPTQDVVDHVAVYVQTAIDLAHSRFLDEDECNAGIAGSHDDKQAQAFLAPPETLLAAVTLFRKIWAEGERTRFETIANSLRQHSPHQLVINNLDRLRSQVREAKEKWVYSPLRGVKDAVTPNELVRDVINTLHLHTGFEKGSRQRYEQLCTQYGTGWVEFTFETQFRWMCYAYWQHGVFAAGAIRRWKRDFGLAPSVQLNERTYKCLGLPCNNVGSSRRPAVERKELAIDRLRRVLHRNRFHQLNDFLEKTGILDEKIFETDQPTVSTLLENAGRKWVDTGDSFDATSCADASQFGCVVDTSSSARGFFWVDRQAKIGFGEHARLLLDALLLEAIQAAAHERGREREREVYKSVLFGMRIWMATVTVVEPNNATG